ncbi:ABC transporter substrate-binding protein [Roseomonas elaeocarpi]|uniref:ABC transporter substrate-binding protein n=1 Tax=Roseomonas elaeocarpi TaxID=907779 RepID=A0ABV6JPW0_9PROT
MSPSRQRETVHGAMGRRMWEERMISRRQVAGFLGVTALGMPLVGRGAGAQTPPGLADPVSREALQPLVEGAKKEGSLTYWDTIIQPDSNDELAAAFRKHYGLPGSFRVNYSVAGSLALITRVEQEISANRVTIDVAAVGTPSWCFQKAQEGAFLAYDAPEYAHYGRSFDMGLGLRPYFAFNGAYIFTPMWNADALKFNGRSWQDLIGSVPAGRFGYSDVSQSAAHLAAYTMMRRILPAEYFRKIAEMKPFFANRSQQVTDRLISGQDLINFAGQPNRAWQYNQKGVNLKVYYPEEGVPLIPQQMFILKAAPHPNAAKLWLNFVLSEEGQSIIAKREILSSGRDGFASPYPEYAPPIDQVKVIPIDWKSVSAADLDKAKQEWISIFNP